MGRDYKCGAGVQSVQKRFYNRMWKYGQLISTGNNYFMYICFFFKVHILAADTVQLILYKLLVKGNYIPVSGQL